MTSKPVTSLLLVMLAACGAKTNPSLCDQTSVTPNPVCNQTCNATPGIPDSCPSGYHCAPDGECDAQCDPIHPCNDGFTCDLDTGTCLQDGTGSNTGPDANCPAVNFTAMPTTPSIQFLIDQSGSMDQSFPGGGNKYDAVREALVGTQGVVTQFEQQIYFGASMYSEGDAGAGCPYLDTVTRAKGRRADISTLFNTDPGGNTPTPTSMDKAVAEFMANPPPAGSPPIIVLATDGVPNQCGDSGVDTRAQSVAAAAAAYAAGIKVFALSVGDAVGNQHLQDLANAGAGVQTGQPNAPYFVGNNAAELSAAFQSIIGGVLSCDLMLSGQVDPQNASVGTVTLNGTTLTYGTDWTVAGNGTTLTILGQACEMLKSSAMPNVAATFPCGSVIF
ncbi:MAG: VWA domain-containing protein [Deltaproteobacteria bacterium]|nr:VWA domain-containing protein [Deltaproteobacteria bacterium]